MFSQELAKTMRVRPLAFAIAATVLVVRSSYAKREKMPLPSKVMTVMTAKTIYIDNSSGLADLGDKAYDELRKWGRFQIVDSVEKASVVFCFCPQESTLAATRQARITTLGAGSDPRCRSGKDRRRG